MGVDTSLIKFKAINDLINTIFEENHLNAETIFVTPPQLEREQRQKAEKLLDSREDLSEELQIAKSGDFVDDIHLGNYYVACKKYSNAMRYFDSALSKNPESYTALCNKGFCFF